MKDFKQLLETSLDDVLKIVATEKNEWSVKGFIDVYKNIYTVSLDTKVVSKIIELMIFPVIASFAKENNYEMILSTHQNHYPDVTFIDNDSGEKIALDLKSTYRISETKINGMTLGAFTGYFRNRSSNKNITFPYSQYSKHYVLGVIYSKSDLVRAEKVLSDRSIELNNTQRKKLASYLASTSDSTLDEFISALGKLSNEQEKGLRELIVDCVIDEKIKYNVDNLQSITSVVRDFEFFVQEKWKIAIDRPGSGNTKNIGSTTKISELLEGKAVFTKQKDGQEIFNDYWMYYLTSDMARAVELKKPPYTNLKNYFKYKNTNG